MTSPNLADSEGLWPLPENVCRSPRPGLVRVRTANGPWRLTCVNAPENGQNGLHVRMHEDPYALVPGQMTIDDMIAAPLASLEDVAAAEYATHLVQALLAGERPKPPPASVAQAAPKLLRLSASQLLSLRSPGVGMMSDGRPFRAFVPTQVSIGDTPTLDVVSLAAYGTIASTPCPTTEEC